jgi:hypothetical protein
MSLQALIDAASPNDTVQLSGDYSESATVVINKPLTIIGRATPSSGARPVVTVTTAGNGEAVSITVSDVTLRGVEFVHTSAFSSNDTCLGFKAGVAADFVAQSALPVNENFTVDDCKIVYSKFGIVNMAKNMNITNCELHSSITTTTSIRGVTLYHHEGSSTINNNVFTTAGGVALQGLFAQHNGSNGYSNQHSGNIQFNNNQSTVLTNQRFVHLQAGVATNNPVGSPTLSMQIDSNTIAAGTAATSFSLFETTSNLSLESIGQITITNNTINSAFRDGVMRVARVSGTALDTYTNTPKFIIFGNTEQTNMGTSTGLVLENVLALTGYTGLPSDIDTILSIVAPAAPPAPADPLVEALSELASGSTSSSIQVSDLIGGGSNTQPVQVTKFTASAPVVIDKVFSSGSTSSTVRLILLNSTDIPYEKTLSVFPNTWRSNISGYASPISFTVKFIDPTDLSQFVSNPGTQNYTISVPEIASRAYLKIYKENDDGSVTFVTNADKITGESYLYGFSLNSNSVYTVADSGVMFASAGVGSDPHVTTITGNHWIMPGVKGRNRDISILSDGVHEIRGHIQGYQNGEFMSKAVITEKGVPLCEIDYQRNKIRILRKDLVKVMSQVQTSQLKNAATSKKSRQTLFLDAFNPGGVFLYIDFQTRYICPIFNHAVQNPRLRGLVM